MSIQRADGVKDKIQKARTALDNAHASEVAGCAHQATLEAPTKAQPFLAVVPYVTENVVRAYDDIDELIKSAGRDQEQARKVWESRRRGCEASGGHVLPLSAQHK